MVTGCDLGENVCFLIRKTGIKNFSFLLWLGGLKDESVLETIKRYTNVIDVLQRAPKADTFLVLFISLTLREQGRLSA